VTLEGKIYENLTEVGATGSAAVPLALDDAWRKGRLAPGDKVMLLAIETSKWIYAGMVVDWTAALRQDYTSESATERALA
jgi:3-oxoacyl-[acyl-carrier-protein] synthase-3